jgi:hypothetical protein
MFVSWLLESIDRGHLMHPFASSRCPVRHSERRCRNVGGDRKDGRQVRAIPGSGTGNRQMRVCHASQWSGGIAAYRLAEGSRTP